MSDDLAQEMRRWGMATAVRFAHYEDGPSRGDSVMAKVKDFAPGTKARAERALIGRDGISRRRAMVAAACRPGPDGKPVRLGMNAVPMWACDPTPARNDASQPRDHAPAAVDLGVPDDLLWAERLVIQLERQNLMRGRIVREEFTGTGTQAMKARRIEVAFGGTLSLRQYRYELARAMDWMRGRREIS